MYTRRDIMESGLIIIFIRMLFNFVHFYNPIKNINLNWIITGSCLYQFSAYVFCNKYKDLFSYTSKMILYYNCISLYTIIINIIDNDVLPRFF